MAKYQLSKEEIKQLQRLIGTKEDGLWGPKSKAALNEFTLSQFEPMTEPSTAEYNPLFSTGRLGVKVDKPEPVEDYREVKQDKEPINYMDALLALKNLESNRPMPRVPSSWVGWASYINSGDRGLLSEFAEADKAWNMKKLEEEEKARQLISNIREKELDRKNAKEIAGMNRSEASSAKLEAIEKELNSLIITKQTLDAQGKDSREVTARIEQIYKKYPNLQTTLSTDEYDPRDNPDYQLAKISKVNAKNSTVEAIDEAIKAISKYKTPEVARRLAELDLELLARKKADESGETLQNEIKAFDTSTGNLSDYLANKKYTVAITAGGYKLIDPKGKVVKSPKPNKPYSWD